MSPALIVALLLVPPALLSLGANLYLLRALRKELPGERVPVWIALFYPSPLAGVLAYGLFSIAERSWPGDADTGTRVALAITLAIFLPLGLAAALRVQAVRSGRSR